ncbi:14 kDa zinc-binding protein isoform X4 [Gossypium hirsutum]|uniref:14 kDa zinc-binding protein isoform X4 n=1 Tax=Gossypium hirsutum TaxID=3635 RepID=A0ABM3BX81_GOSHI|nr:14 kDa zinc-binding protein isoform X4 [Gossypium hirsutum]
MALEKEAALAAAPSDSPTIFDKIINKEIPATVVYEDDKTGEPSSRLVRLSTPTVLTLVKKAHPKAVLVWMSGVFSSGEVKNSGGGKINYCNGEIRNNGGVCLDSNAAVAVR